ncbi:zinc finger protein 92-like [Trichogramma pretiosum]|uniref:zinc finger protein 92-like n=1 Tax=Trichogramma pretiosum TaxID=7493 RepID=UPI000C71B96F|nr:zinc finger protein 92-like [Trichogramma pretiosum]
MDPIRVKEEPSDNWPDVNDDQCDSGDSCEAENVEAFLFHELSAKHEKKSGNIDERIFIDFECKDVKPDLKPLSITDYKTERQIFLPTVQVENENQSNDVDRNIIIDFECSDFKLEQKPSSTSIHKTEYQSCQSILNVENKIQKKDKVHKIIHRNVKLYKCKHCQKDFGQRSNLQSHILMVHKKKKDYKCDKCPAAFTFKHILRDHINAVHQCIKAYKCKKCPSTFTFSQARNRHWKLMHTDKTHSDKMKVATKPFVEIRITEKVKNKRNFGVSVDKNVGSRSPIKNVRYRPP